MQQLRIVIAILTGILVLPACGGGFQFVKRPQPSGMISAKKISIVPLTFDGLMIGEKEFSQYLDDKEVKADAKGAEDRSAAKWDEWKAIWRKEMTDTISGYVQAVGAELAEVAAVGDATDGFVVHVNVEFIEPGYYAVVAARPSQTRVRVKIFQAGQAEPIYEFLGTSSTSNYSTGGRIGADIKGLAQKIGRFLRAEIEGK